MSVRGANENSPRSANAIVRARPKRAKGSHRSVSQSSEVISLQEDFPVQGEITTLMAATIEHIRRQNTVRESAVSNERADALSEQYTEMQSLVAMKDIEITGLEDKVHELEKTLSAASKALVELRERERRLSSEAITKWAHWKLDFETKLTNLQLKEQEKLSGILEVVGSCKIKAVSADVSKTVAELQDRYTTAQQEFAATIEREKQEHEDEIDLWVQKAKDIAGKARGFQTDILRLTNSETEKEAKLSQIKEALEEANTRTETNSTQLAAAQTELDILRTEHSKLKEALEAAKLAIPAEDILGQLQKAKEDIGFLTTELEENNKEKDDYKAAFEKEQSKSVNLAEQLASARNTPKGECAGMEGELESVKESKTRIECLEQQLELKNGQLQMMELALQNVSTLVGTLRAQAISLVETKPLEFDDDDDLFE